MAQMTQAEFNASSQQPEINKRQRTPVAKPTPPVVKPKPKPVD